MIDTICFPSGVIVLLTLISSDSLVSAGHIKPFLTSTTVTVSRATDRLDAQTPFQSVTDHPFAILIAPLTTSAHDSQSVDSFYSLLQFHSTQVHKWLQTSTLSPTMSPTATLTMASPVTTLMRYPISSWAGPSHARSRSCPLALALLVFHPVLFPWQQPFHCL